MRRILHAGAIVLVASMGSASFAAAQTAADFAFTYDSDYSDQGLSHPYAGTTTTGQSYGTGVAIDASDTAQMVYSLVEANPNIGVGGLRGGFPADSRTLSASSSTPGYLGPYYIVRRAGDGTIDSAFGDNGYVSDFGNSADNSYKFTSLCIDPGTGNMVLVGQQTTSSGPVGLIERLLQPAGGSDSASLDSSFNPSGPTPGVVTISTPNGNNNPTPYGCTVVDEGTGHSGAILVGGVDQRSGSSLILAAKVSSFGGSATLVWGRAKPRAFWTGDCPDLRLRGAPAPRTSTAQSGRFLGRPQTNVAEPFKELIGDPIGMTNFHVSQCEYTKPDVDSIHPAYVFRMTAVDLVKFVELYVNGGSYEGRQIVPAGWIERSLTPHTVIPNGNCFGYLWEVCQAGRLFGVDLGPGAFGSSEFPGHYVAGFPRDELALVYAHSYDLVGKATLQPGEFSELLRAVAEASVG